MSVSRLILAAGTLAVLGVAPSASAQCCVQQAPFDNEAGEQACTDGTNNWTCPDVRAHMPVQWDCSSGGGPLQCLGTGQKRMVTVLSVSCGTSRQPCTDGPPVTWKTPANNDSCSGQCPNQGASLDCEPAERNQLMEQTLELERLLEEAKSHLAP